MRAQASRIKAMIEPAVRALGFELVGVEYHPGRRVGLLRVYIDGERGVTVDDCARVSNQVSGLLDVEDPISGQYNLEVSSPGLDRPLFEPRHYERFRGHAVRVRMAVPVDGRRNFRGILAGLRDGVVVVREDEVEHLLPLDSVGTARLAPEHTAPTEVPD